MYLGFGGKEVGVAGVSGQEGFEGLEGIEILTGIYTGLDAAQEGFGGSAGEAAVALDVEVGDFKEVVLVGSLNLDGFFWGFVEVGTLVAGLSVILAHVREGDRVVDVGARSGAWAERRVEVAVHLVGNGEPGVGFPVFGGCEAPGSLDIGEGGGKFFGKRVRDAAGLVIRGIFFV